MGGAGLGLALVTEIARQHGGQVKVLESNEKGSTIDTHAAAIRAEPPGTILKPLKTELNTINLRPR